MSLRSGLECREAGAWPPARTLFGAGGPPLAWPPRVSRTGYFRPKVNLGGAVHEVRSYTNGISTVFVTMCTYISGVSKFNDVYLYRWYF